MAGQVHVVCQVWMHPISHRRLSIGATFVQRLRLGHEEVLSHFSANALLFRILSCCQSTHSLEMLRKGTKAHLNLFL